MYSFLKNRDSSIERNEFEKKKIRIFEMDQMWQSSNSLKYSILGLFKHFQRRIRRERERERDGERERSFWK